GQERMREVEKMILLRVVDNHWMDHIDAMDDLKRGIGLRAIGQINPAQAYASEGFDMFEMMVEEIREETVRYCYGVTVNTGTERRQVIVGGEGHKEDFHDDEPRTSQGTQPQASMPAQAPKEQKVQKPVTVKREEPKVGRNDPCPCGSGKKYKACCGK
ncbi:MAG: SEC-C domain-containing protein, partial [Firmicutes bacterium]|nr:SEC-C domain-containing protein [Bacillota bacterium]